MAEEKVVAYDPSANYDEATLTLQRQIEKEIAGSSALVGDKVDVDILEKEYLEDEIYIKKLKDLKSKYPHFRRIRADGNCFFRAFGYAYLERLLQHPEESKRFKDFATKSKDTLVALGFPQFTLEDFHDTFMEAVEKADRPCEVKELLEMFNDQGYSDYLVVYFRLLVSGHLQKEEDFFACFIDGFRTVKEFCNQEVEPMGKESDHIHIIALAAAIDVPIRVEYMDRTGSDTSCTVTAHDFPEGSTPCLHLLYRPGHYDILYK